MTEEKRQYHRIKIDLPVTFKAEAGHQHLSPGNTLDISGIGISLITREKMEQGQNILLQMTLPTKDVIRLKTQVIWVKETEVFGACDCRAGLQIVEDVSMDDMKYVKLYSKELHDQFKEAFEKKRKELAS